MKNNVKNLEQDESILVNVSIDKFWNFCTQLNNIQLFINMPNSEIINEGNNILKLVDKSSNNYIRLIKREDIPKTISSVLGSTNREIINNIIMDIINNSLNKPYIKLSEKVFKAIFELKRFNYEHIYKYSLTEKKRAYYKEGMNRLFKNYLTDIKNNNKNSEIYTVFLNNQSSKYNKNTSEKRKVIDFIAGMTDDYFIKKIDNL